MKVSKVQIYYVLIILSLMFQNRFFHLINASSNLTLCLILDIIILFFIALNDKKINPGKWIYNYLLLVLVIVILPQTVYVFLQGETIDGYIDVVRGLLNLLLALPLIKFFLRNKSIIKFLDVLAILTIVTLGLVLINSFFLNTFGNQLLPFEYFQKPSTGRLGRIRIFLISDFTGFVCIYSFARFIKSESRKIFYLISFAICLLCEIYVEQARVLYMSMVASCVLIFAQTLKAKKVAFYIISVLIALLGLVGEWFDSFFAMFSVSNKGLGISTLIRINEIKYAFELIKQHPLLGTGMSSRYIFPITLDGFYFEFNHTDIGLLGTITYIGLLGTIIIFVIPYIRIIKTISICPDKYKNSYEFYFLFGIIIYVSITSFTVAITDNARIFAWPFVIAFNEYVRRRWIFAKYENNEKSMK